MADLLGSILSTMEKPPGLDEKQKKMLKAQKEKETAVQTKEKERLKKFKENLQCKIADFMKNPDLKKYTFSNMTKVDRSIVHEVAETAGLVSFSFGTEEVDRHIVIWKKEFAPSEDELVVTRRGEEWNEEKAIEIANERSREAEISEHRNAAVKKSTRGESYESTIASSAIEVKSAQSYGFVSSDLKKDKRSIEETLNEIRAKKKKHNEDTSGNKL